MSGPTFDDVNVQGNVIIRGFRSARFIAGCIFIAAPGAGGPVFASQDGFTGFVQNGVGDYTFTLATDPGPFVGAGITPLLFSGGLSPFNCTLVPMPGGARVLMTDLATGLPVDEGFTLILLATN